MRGATAWKRVQVHAAGLTQNRRLELLKLVQEPTRCTTVEELAEKLPVWERRMRELEKFKDEHIATPTRKDTSVGWLSRRWRTTLAITCP